MPTPRNPTAERCGNAVDSLSGSWVLVNQMQGEQEQYITRAKLLVSGQIVSTMGVLMNSIALRLRVTYKMRT